MIDSNIIEWLDFGDSTQKIDTYSKSYLKVIFKLFRTLLKNKHFQIVEIVFMLISFIQIISISSVFLPSDEDIILEIVNYLKNVFLLFDMITNREIYKKFYITIQVIFTIDLLFMLIILFTMNFVKINTVIALCNLLNISIFYYLIGPFIEICLFSFWCENGKHKFLDETCFSNMQHLLYIIVSMIFFVLYALISILYSKYCIEIGTIDLNSKNSITRIHCNYEFFCTIVKIIIFVLYFILKVQNYLKLFQLIYEGCIIIISLIILIYAYKNVYYYNDIINYIIYYGWSFCFWYSLCIFLKILFQLKFVSSFIIIGWIIIVISIYKLNKMVEFLLITNTNILEFKSVKSIEMYKTVLLKQLANKNKTNEKILLYGNIKNFEEFNNNIPEIHFQYQKLINDKYLNLKFDKEIELPILSIIYILYSTHLEKITNKLEIAIYMSYFLINKYNNTTYAISLCSKIKGASHIGLYYKYILSEDIRESLTFKINKMKNHKIKHLEIGNIILYYLYIDIFKMRIYDAVCNRIDYFDIIKNSVTTNKSTNNLLKLSETIRQTRKVIMKVWKQLIEINAFSDEPRKYYMIYIDIILQDDFLSKNETKKYSLLKISKLEERFNTYHSMFISDLSTIILVDGYLTVGKILYSSENFPLLFNYNVKELLGLNIDDLLPSNIQTFHKELIDNAIKYSNVNYIYKKQIDSLLKNKNGLLVNIKLFLKPSPNISYGLTYFIYLQRDLEHNKFIIVIDKDLKINGYTEINRAGDSFTMEEGYNLHQGLLGYHIGSIIPDILPLLEYNNDEFNIINDGLELKGYLYQVHKINEIKSKVDNILDKIRSKKRNNSNINQKKIEENILNISEEFNDLIELLNKEKNKPFSIFYRIKMFSFLDGKYKYYRIYIANDNITENEKEENIKNKNEENEDTKSKKENSIDMKMESSVSNINLNSNKNLQNIKKGNRKKILLANNLNNNMAEKNEEKKNFDTSVNNDSKKKELEEEKDIKNNANNNIHNIKPQNTQPNSTNIDKLKIDIVNRQDMFQIKIMKYLGLIFWIATIFFLFYNKSLKIQCFSKLSEFLQQNLNFKVTKMNLAIIYISTLNIKWELHLCYNNYYKYNMTSLYEKLVKQTVGYLLSQKNSLNSVFDEYKEIIEKKYETNLIIYGTHEKEKYNFNLDNMLTFFIDSGIKLLRNYPDFLKRVNESQNQLGDLEYGINELYDLIEQSYLYFISDIDGFKEEVKIKKVKKVFNNFPLAFILNGFLSVIIIIFYIILIIQIHNIEIYFVDKLINFNSTNFDGFLKKLEELKKKFRNENNEEEEKEEENEMDSKKEDEENEKTEDQKVKLVSSQKSLKSNKKSKKKDGNKQKQKKNKLKIMTFFFIKANISFIIKIIVIIIISLTYYIISIFIETTKKNEFLTFDEINNEIFETFKESFDIFLIFKKQLEIYEENLTNCIIDDNKELYKMKIPIISDIKTPNLGDSIVQINGESGFKKETIEELGEFFSGDACEILKKNSDEPMDHCSSLLNGALTKGMEQTFTKMGSTIGTIIEEFNSLDNGGKYFKDIASSSTFSTYEIFIEFYFQKAYLFSYDIFTKLRSEKLNSINNLLQIILILYVILFNVLVILIIYFIYSTKSIYNSFLNFIWILPVKYLSEDEIFYKEIIKFGKNSYS